MSSCGHVSASIKIILMRSKLLKLMTEVKIINGKVKIINGEDKINGKVKMINGEDKN